MKKLFNLPTNLRILFGVTRLFVFIGGVLVLPVWLILSFIPSTSSAHSAARIAFLDVVLKVPVGSITLKSKGSGADDIQITRLVSDLDLNLRGHDPELVAAVRWTLIPKFLVEFTLLWFLLGLLRNLCARVEKGEIFSEANLRAIRNIGLLFVTFAFVDAGLHLWTAQKLGGYFARNVVVSGMNASYETGLAQAGTFSVSDLITGLLVLLVAEAFRQGLALKQENELTV